ncbi:MAG TPA: MFS transporter [Stellaceae bacterium]|nr:MFS transporter [Stellaceae bacterium]
MAAIEQIDPRPAIAILARMERLPVSWWHVKARIIVGIGTFFDAVDLLAIASALPVLAGTWHMNPQQIASVLSAAFWGQLIGALLAGWAAELWGRLRVTTLAIGTYSVMSLACAFAWDPTSLIVFRFIQGIGLGAEVPIANTYVNEIARAEVRGRFYLLFQMVFGVGIVTASVLGYFLVPTLGWQSMFYIGALPALLAFVMRLLLPESPRWLVQKGRYAEADRIVTEIEESITRSGKTLPPPNPASVSTAAPQRRRWFEMFEGIYLKRTLSDWAFWFCCFSTSYGLSTWLPTLYRTVFHLSVVDSLKYGMITSCGGIIAALCCAFFIDYVGRRAWFTGAFIIGGLILLTLWPVGTETAEKVLIFVTAGSFFISSLALAINLYTSEIYPTRIRAFSGAVGGAWQRVAAILGTNVVAWLLPYGTGSLFLYFGGLALIGGVLSFFFAVETKGKTLEELSP